ncbi:MAG: DUF1851 domain-containing protein [Burkholderiales bacterium]|nr:DUF1851 domain-containing protein [Burkholderiales bacterium]
MELVEHITRAWGWSGIRPTEVIGQNDFGNLMVKDEDGRYWRISPEDLYCRLVANDRAEFDVVVRSQAFLQDWYMAPLAVQALERLGPLEHHQKYCFKIPGVLGGEYGGSNLAKITLSQLIEASGHIARQVAELPDGTQVKLLVTE